jgi:beta-xylosidase
VELRFGRSARDITATVSLRLTGAVREVGPDRRLLSEVHLGPVVSDPVSPAGSGNPGRSL